MSNEWLLTPLRDLLRPALRPDTVKATQEYRLLGVRLNAGGPFLRETKLGAETSATTLYKVQTGDFIYSRLFAWRGAFGVIPDQLDGCYVSNEFPIFTVIPGRLDAEFLRLWFTLPSVLKAVEEECTGSTPLRRNRYKEEFFLKLRIPLPSLAEQQRIVARVEELAGKIERARRLRAEAMAAAAVLHESATRVLFASLKNVHLSTIDEIAEVRGGIQKGPHRSAGDNPARYVTVAHVQRNKISLADPRFFEVSPLELERWRLCSGDVLVIEGNGSADQIGRTALFRGEIENCVHQNHVIRVRSDRSVIEPEFLNAYLNSPAGQRAVQEVSRTSSGLRHLSVGRINALPVPLPSLEVQNRIVIDLSKTRIQVENITKQQSESGDQWEALLPSVLSKAFAGEL